MDPGIASLVWDELARAGATARAVAVAIRARGETESAAFVRPGAGVALAADAPFVLYSITKTFLAAAALRLVSRGLLELDVGVGRWLPWAPHGERITLRHLLQHTSGLPDYGPLAAYHAAVRAGEAPWTDAEFLERTGASTLRSVPGVEFRYSNIGYLLVRRLLESAAGAPLGEVLQAELLAPLALHETFTPTDADLPRLTFGPSALLGDGAPRGVAGHYHLGWVAHGVLASTAGDVARFLEALLGGELLPPALVSELCALREVGPVARQHPFRRPGYGLGLMGELDGDTLGHTGGGPGASTATYRRGRATVAVLTSGDQDDLAEQLAMALLARAVPARG